MSKPADPAPARTLCNCGGEPCIGPERLRGGYDCERQAPLRAELAALQSAHAALLAEQTAQLRRYFCIRCHHRWTGGLAPSYCGDCHRECQDLAARLAQAEQERDAVIFLRGARAKAVAEGYAQGRADALAQVKAMVERRYDTFGPLEWNAAISSILYELDAIKAHQLDALPVSPPQENTEKERA